MRILSVLHSGVEHTILTFCRQCIFCPNPFDPYAVRAFLPVELAALMGAAFFVI